MTEAMSAPLVLIDLSSIAYPLWHVSGQEPDPDWTSTQIVAKIRALASAHPHVAICADTGRSFRVSISEAYKQTRPERDATLQHQIDVAIARLQGDGYPIWRAAGFEADDVIASALACAGLAGPDDGREVYADGALVISADKDLLQLVGDHVQVFRPALGTAVARTYDAAAVHEKFGVAPNQFVDFLALVGDKSDNIAGAKGIGAVTAAKLLTQYGTLDDLDAAMEAGEASTTPAIGRALIEFFAGEPSPCALARDLIRLRLDVPIAFAEIFRPRVPVETAAFTGDAVDDIAFALQPLEETAHDDVGRPDPPRADRTDGGDRGPRGGAGPLLPGGRTPDPGVRPVPPHERPEESRELLPRQASAVARQAVDWERQLEPSSISEAKELATWMFQSRLFSAYGTPQAVLATVLAGRELGFQAMASLRAFHVIENRPTLSAGAIHALVLRSGKAKYFRCTERTPDRATFETKRGDDPPVSLTFTVDEAKQAWTKEPAKFLQSGWGRNPADMCVARCSTKLARLVYPDVLNNLYAAEEFE